MPYKRCGGTREAWNTEHCRGEPGSAISGGYTPDSAGGGQLDRRRARGGVNPYERESKPRTGRLLREKLMSDYGLFSSYEGHKERRTGKIRGAFSRMHKTLNGWMLTRARASTSSRPPPPWTSVFQFSLFLYDV